MATVRFHVAAVVDQKLIRLHDWIYSEHDGWAKEKKYNAMKGTNKNITSVCRKKYGSSQAPGDYGWIMPALPSFGNQRTSVLSDVCSTCEAATIAVNPAGKLWTKSHLPEI